MWKWLLDSLRFEALMRRLGSRDFRTNLNRSERCLRWKTLVFFFPTKCAPKMSVEKRYFVNTWYTWVRNKTNVIGRIPKGNEKVFRPSILRCENVMIALLGGGFKYSLFSPRTLGKMNPFRGAYFSDGLVQPTSHGVLVFFWYDVLRGGLGPKNNERWRL